MHSNAGDRPTAPTGPTHDRRFRFGIVTGQPQPAAALAAAARRLQDQGYGAVLFPDTAHTVPPAIGSAVAAAGADTVHVGPHVLSVANRTPGQAAAETAALHTLTAGRYELGLGVGRPGAGSEAAALGMPFGSVAERMALLERTVAAVRERTADTPIMIAAGRPRMLQLAGRLADIVTLGLPPRAPEPELALAARTLLDGAGDRADRLELAQNLLAVGDHAPPEVLRWSGLDLPGLRAAGSAAVLSGPPEQMADVLLRRRDEYGISYISTSAAFADALAPVVERLAGR